MDYLKTIIKTRNWMLVVAGFCALNAFLAGAINRSMLYIVITSALAIRFLYIAVVRYERPMKIYQRAIVCVEFLLLVLPCYQMILAVVLYMKQVIK